MSLICFSKTPQRISALQNFRDPHRESSLGAEVCYVPFTWQGQSGETLMGYHGIKEQFISHQGVPASNYKITIFSHTAYANFCQIKGMHAATKKADRERYFVQEWGMQHT
jgi:hypothetical protein